MGSVHKGRRGEQEVGRILYKMWYNADPPADRTVFVRVGLGRPQPTGDLIVPDDFPFWVEVKNKEMDLTDIRREFVHWIFPYLDYLCGRKEGKGIMFVFKHKRKWWCLADLNHCTKCPRPPDNMLFPAFQYTLFVLFPLERLKEYI